MDHFKAVHFHGQFRSYQAKVLDHADQYLKDGKINIVAAPGSGKTVLGLELIRRIGEPCVILSPTTAIREQWGDRFRTMFLDDQSLFPELFSNDLHRLRLMNSITYQALYTAIEKKPVETEEDTDCSDIDIFQTIRDHGIRTICLDEAHHLKNEWQRALETFMGQLDGDMKVIALTATPPYDSDGSEWERYQKVCGEIDEEIFVPELVAQNTLCPHQDYVYFSYPTQAEQDMLQEYKKNAALAVEEMGRMPVFSTICRNLNASRDYETLFASAKEYIALLVLLQKFGFPISKRIVKQMTAGRGLPSFQMKYAETAIQFLLDGELLAEDEKLKIVELLKNYQVYSKRRAALDLNEKLKKTLISSTGKLESIRQIADCEFSNMGSQLRMLVLTDYIKKEDVPKIATGEELTSVSVVSIFETIRKGNEAVNIGVLSGSLVILPDTIDLSGVKHKRQHIEGTRYSVVDIAGSNHETVGLVGKLFKTGAIQILVGTKSLLGEGWDSPCINSLILASFVGSFVLSNQMRGRAIRIDKNNPDKTGNIWHLVSVEPEYIYKDKAVERLGAYWNQDKEQLTSCDYEMLKRRFDAFMGPNYTTGVIESGIERITAIAPPYDQKGIERINREMLSRASDRAGIAAQWDGEVADGRFQVAVETQVPTEKKVPIFTFINFGFMVMLTFVETMILQRILMAALDHKSSITVSHMIVFLVCTAILLRAVRRLMISINPARSMKVLGTAVYEALRECSLISPSAKVEAIHNKDYMFVSMFLRNASLHDQNVFNTAITELLSPIENPRYILIGKTRLKRYNYRLSFACPGILGKKREYVDVLAKKLKKKIGGFEAVYAHKENGRKLILTCRRQSYITYNQRVIEDKFKVVSHWE